jgi:hypothetical protein
MHATDIFISWNGNNLFFVIGSQCRGINHIVEAFVRPEMLCPDKERVILFGKRRGFKLMQCGGDSLTLPLV